MDEFLENYLLEVIEQLEKVRETNHIEPLNVPYKQIQTEVLGDIRNTLNALYVKKRIKVSKLVDDLGVLIINEQ